MEKDIEMTDDSIIEKATQSRFFCISIGATLQLLSYFTHHSTKALLHKASRHTRTFYSMQENNIFKMCLPSVFSSRISHVKTIKGDLNRFVIRVRHLRDDLYLVAYASNELEIRDFSTNTLVDKMQLNFHEPLVDFDFYQNELSIIVGFRSDICMFVDFHRKSAN